MALIHLRDLVIGLPEAVRRAVRQAGLRLTPDVLCVRVRTQRMIHFRRVSSWSGTFHYARKACVVSTSRFGIGQREGSNQTPLGLHRIAEKIGGGWPAGTVFRSRKPVAFTWKPDARRKAGTYQSEPRSRVWRGQPGATITTRILWLDGLEPGFNRGGDVDSHARYIYIHGTGDETSLGRPASCGCIHMRADDLMPLFDSIAIGTLVWIEP